MTLEPLDAAILTGLRFSALERLKADLENAESNKDSDLYGVSDGISIRQRISQIKAEMASRTWAVAIIHDSKHRDILDRWHSQQECKDKIFLVNDFPKPRPGKIYDLQIIPLPANEL